MWRQVKYSYTLEKTVRENTLLFPAKESLVSDISAGDSKTANLCLQCNIYAGIMDILQ